MLSFFKESVTFVIYELADFLGNYAAAYILIAVFMSIFSFAYRCVKSKSDYLCDKFAPYVAAVETKCPSKQKQDELLERLYSDNHFNSLKMIVFTVIYTLFSIVIYSSLFVITSEAHDISPNFLWVADITCKKIDIPISLIFCLIFIIDIYAARIHKKQLTGKQLVMELINIASACAKGFFYPIFFSPLLLLYKIVRKLLGIVYKAIYTKYHKPYDDIIVCDEMQELLKYNQMEGGVLSADSEQLEAK